MNQIIFISVAVSLVIFGCKETTSEVSDSPLSDLGHIDVILDSATWYAIKNDSFIQNEFGVLTIDTAYYGGKPSYDLYILGHLNFLHLSLAKEFWEHQHGGGVLVFQTQKPGQKEQLLKSWKKFYDDSLFVHSYKGSEFTLEEIMAWYKHDSTKVKEASMFANLTSYSEDAYKNWGISDSIINAGAAMKQFMGGWAGESLKTRLFSSISELYMTINKQEFKEIKSSLLAVGYKENKMQFIHSSNPTVFITISEEKERSKYTKVKFNLTRSIDDTEIVFSPMAKLKLSRDEGWFLFE